MLWRPLADRRPDSVGRVLQYDVSTVVNKKIDEKNKKIDASRVYA